MSQLSISSSGESDPLVYRSGQSLAVDEPEPNPSRMYNKMKAAHSPLSNEVGFSLALISPPPSTCGRQEVRCRANGCVEEFYTHHRLGVARTFLMFSLSRYLGEASSICGILIGMPSSPGKSRTKDDRSPTCRTPMHPSIANLILEYMPSISIISRPSSQLPPYLRNVRYERSTHVRNPRPSQVPSQVYTNTYPRILHERCQRL